MVSESGWGALRKSLSVSESQCAPNMRYHIHVHKAEHEPLRGWWEGSRDTDRFIIPGEGWFRNTYAVVGSKVEEEPPGRRTGMDT